MPRAHRIRRTEELRARADEILAVATHERLRGFVLFAVTHIDDASAWLLDPDVEHCPATLAVIDLDLAFAEYRLRAASAALSMRGPGAGRII